MDPYSAPVDSDADERMDADAAFSVCPRCDETMELCFTSSRDLGLVTCGQMMSLWWFAAEALSRRSFLDRFGDIRSRYFCSYLCRACGCFIIDSVMELTIADARRMAFRPTFGRPSAVSTAAQSCDRVGSGQD